MWRRRIDVLVVIDEASRAGLEQCYRTAAAAAHADAAGSAHVNLVIDIDGEDG